MSTTQDKSTRYIFPEAANKPQALPWWAKGNYLSDRGPTPVGNRSKGKKRWRRNVFYDARTGAPASQTGGQDQDLEIIREVLRPRSSIVVNDPSGWLDGRASQDFQKFFSRTPEQEANYARRKRELDAGSVAAIDPRITRNAVDVARKNREAMEMIFPKPTGVDVPTLSSDIGQYSLPDGTTLRTLDGRYGTGSAKIVPNGSTQAMVAPKSPSSQKSLDLNFQPLSSSSDAEDSFGVFGPRPKSMNEVTFAPSPRMDRKVETSQPIEKLTPIIRRQEPNKPTQFALNFAANPAMQNLSNLSMGREVFPASRFEGVRQNLPSEGAFWDRFSDPTDLSKEIGAVEGFVQDVGSPNTTPITFPWQSSRAVNPANPLQYVEQPGLTDQLLEWLKSFVPPAVPLETKLPSLPLGF